MITIAKLTLSRVWHGVAVRSGWRTVANRLRYGPRGPAASMRLRLSPADITDRYHVAANDAFAIHHWQTGQTLAGDWDVATRPFDKSLKFGSCKQRFVGGKPWQDTPAWPYGLKRIAELGKYDACRTEADLAARYALLDDLWEKTVASQALPAALHEGASSRTGILVHINRHGQVIFGNQGFHRLSIAKLAHLPSVIVVVGVIHPQAIYTDAYAALLARRVT